MEVIPETSHDDDEILASLATVFDEAPLSSLPKEIDMAELTELDLDELLDNSDNSALITDLKTQINNSSTSPSTVESFSQIDFVTNSPEEMTYEDFNYDNIEFNPMPSEDEGDDYQDLESSTGQKRRRKPYRSRRGAVSQTLNEKQLARLNNEDLDHGEPGQKLFLSIEEKQLLTRYGYKIPTKLPLTRSEDRALRTIRRKIRNKLSAKASRARRQNYVAELEARMNACNNENLRLNKKVNALECEKRGLIGQVRQLSAKLSRFVGYDNTAEQSYLPIRSSNQRKDTSFAPAAGGTSLLVVAFMILAWTAVIPIPSLTQTAMTAPGSNGLASGHSRMLMASEDRVYGPQLESVYDADVNAHQPTPSNEAVKNNISREEAIEKFEPPGKPFSLDETGERLIDQMTLQMAAVAS